ncbi:uncharacterized protein [Aegilops tauschii subsp. strangulata]|uniref:uncharacterized protein n=1 Tax=Aegilops tauschii subsp. strangulata TaxID=200361 RepID=UPI00098B9501
MSFWSELQKTSTLKARVVKNHKSLVLCPKTLIPRLIFCRNHKSLGSLVLSGIMTGGARFCRRGITVHPFHSLDAVRRRARADSSRNPFDRSLPASSSPSLHLFPSPHPLLSDMATASGGGDCGGPAGGGDDRPPEADLCGSSNPGAPSDSSPNTSPQHSLEFAAARSWARAVKADPTESHRWGSSFGGVYLDDAVWEVKMHFHERDNLERSLCISDITYHNLVALIETEGYGLNDYIYFVREPGVGIEGLVEISDDDKVDEMLDHIANKDQTVVNLTVIRATDPRPADLNAGYLYEEQVPLSQLGEKPVYEVNPSGFLFRSPEKSNKQRQSEPLQFFSTQQSTNLDIAMEQDEQETLMELKRRTKIENFRKHKEASEHVQMVKQKLPVLLTEDDSDLDADEDFVKRLNDLRRQREDPLLHFEGDTNVDEVYGEDEEEEQVEQVEEDEQMEHEEEEQVEEQVEQQHEPPKKKEKRKGPTKRSHSSLE